eukprot:2211814-Pleurochrysis_carterae.AAC.2
MAEHLLVLLWLSIYLYCLLYVFCGKCPSCMRYFEVWLDTTWVFNLMLSDDDDDITVRFLLLPWQYHNLPGDLPH